MAGFDRMCTTSSSGFRKPLVLQHIQFKIIVLKCTIPGVGSSLVLNVYRGSIDKDTDVAHNQRSSQAQNCHVQSSLFCPVWLKPFDWNWKLETV